MTIADLVRAHGYRHDFIAGRLGISETQFSRIASGQITPSVARIYQLAKVMRIPVRDVAAVVIPEINEENADAARSAT